MRRPEILYASLDESRLRRLFPIERFCLVRAQQILRTMISVLDAESPHGPIAPAAKAVANAHFSSDRQRQKQPFDGRFEPMELLRMVHNHTHATNMPLLISIRSTAL
jgi:hypothetical protein